MSKANTVYLYNHNELRRADSSLFDDRIKVEPLTKRCHNVEPVGRNIVGTVDWKFQIIGDDTWYVTSYDWSLVEDTPENVAFVKEHRRLLNESDRLRAQAGRPYEQIRNISHREVVA